MKEKEIVIKVCGFAGTGKTCIAQKLTQFLISEGFVVENTDKDKDDFSSNNADVCIKHIAPYTKIKIDCVQLNRSFVINPPIVS